MKSLSKETIEQVKHATLKIASNDAQGSGITIEILPGEFIIATAKHVVSGGGDSATFILTNSSGIKGKIQKKDFEISNDTDLAICRKLSDIQLSGNAIAIDDRVGYNEDIWIAGYAGTSYQDVLRISPGSIMAISQNQEKDGYELIYSNPTSRGMSGGAIINAEGKLVGIHAAGETDVLSNNESASLVYTGANIGVPSKHIISLYNLGSFEESKITTRAENSNQAKDSDQYSTGLESRENPGTLVYELNSIGNERHKNGEYLGAINAYTKAIEIAIEIAIDNTQLAILYFCRGNSWQGAGNINQAFCDLTYAISLDPDDYKSMVHRGNILLFEFNSAERALVDARQALRVMQQNPESKSRPSLAYVLEGNALSELNDANAILSYTNALQHEPTNCHALWGRGRFKAVSGAKDITAAQDIIAAIKYGNQNAREYALSKSGAWIKGFRLNWD